MNLKRLNKTEGAVIQPPRASEKEAPMNKERKDLSQIGEADKHNLCATFLEAILEFYEDPANLARFEEWQRQQQSAEEATQAE